RLSLSLFLFPGTPITEIYALSLHDALPIFEAAPVVVADDRRALAALRPVTAGHVLVAGHERRAVGLRAGENVVLVGTIAACLDRISLLVESRLLVDVRIIVQILDILGDGHALRVPPRPLADAVARVHRLRAADRALAQVSAPCLRARAGVTREFLAIGVGARESAEI